MRLREVLNDLSATGVASEVQTLWRVHQETL